MGNFSDALTKTFADPNFGMAVGLLQGGQPGGGGLGGGFQRGLLNSQNMIGQQNRQQDLRMRTEMMQRQQAQQMQQQQARTQLGQTMNPQDELALQAGFNSPVEALYREPAKPSAMQEYLNMSPADQKMIRDKSAASAMQINLGGDSKSRVWTDEEKDAANIPRADVVVDSAKGEPSILKSGDKQGAEITKMDAAQSAYDGYREALTKYGPRIMPSSEKLKLDATYSNLLLEAKNLFELGVLSGPDVGLIEAVMANPTSPQTQMYDSKQLLDQLDVFGDKLKDAREKLNEKYNISDGVVPSAKPDFVYNPATGKLE